MRWYDPFLYPFAMIYGAVTGLRNRMFDAGIKKRVSFDIPTVVVGNLNVGGSGKTPMVELLIEYLRNDFHLATLSRGYGRKTRGFLMADEKLGPDELGDEPYQIFSKYGKFLTVAVGEDRVMAIPEILSRRPDTNLILLDDAFQHRYVHGDINILLTTFQKPFFKDEILPLGTLRESPKGADRADLVIVTKTPLGVQEELKGQFREAIAKFTDAKIAFAGIRYGKPFPLFDASLQEKSNVILVSGIANDQLLFQEVSKNYKVLHRLNFGDHHHYTEKDVLKIHRLFKESGNCMVLTTEKDAVKLKNEVFQKYLSEIPIFVLPIKVELDEDILLWLKNRLIQIVADKA
ncbi:tetraacyldisaccharide 4'-kinase [Cecembia calidifontis]|jgi:tetraacyldisaccharide 4'-kinase|uniref:Tetraacyldisaccharide 4'-kinase n=1 Tax=Cecembia calidifontis TaxID=1187080 RepID=A0A4Q7P8B3_9BACT|nr:tetraacyldisaccharide 4'-kinase [Cecembia calidifontis]RZS96341.1 lipid-A-disaccharide kinase [Cecembia calidifontis]